MRTQRCPKCEGAMGEGFLLGEKNGTRVVTGWVAGAPKKAWWGLKLPARPIEVQVFRCARCGFLESYANG